MDKLFLCCLPHISQVLSIYSNCFPCWKPIKHQNDTCLTRLFILIQKQNYHTDIHFLETVDKRCRYNLESKKSKSETRKKRTVIMRSLNVIHCTHLCIVMDLNNKRLQYSFSNLAASLYASVTHQQKLPKNGILKLEALHNNSPLIIV